MSHHKENLEIVRQACIVANPAIMELGFGCEVLIADWIVRIITCPLTANEFLGIRIYGGNTGVVRDTVEFKEKAIDKILGRPIRLVDVLVAIRKASPYDDSLAVFCGGDIVKNGDEGFLPEPKVEWNLLKDDIRDQSEETVAFLAGLLSENK